MLTEACKNKFVQTVPAERVKEMTENGWEVVDSFDQDDISEIPVDVAPMQGHQQPRSPLDFQHGGRVTTGYKVVVTRRRYFTVAISQEERDLRAEAAASKAEENRMRKELEYVTRTAEATCKRHVEALGKVEGELEVCKTRLLTANNLTSDANHQRNKLERDLGKLRKAIGKRVFDEVLGTNNAYDNDNDEDE